MERKHHINKRTFLLAESGSSEHAVAIVERSGALLELDPDLDWYVTVYLKIASEDSAASFYFDLGTPEARAKSLERIRTLADLVGEFKEALEKEVQEVEERDSEVSAQEVFVN